MDVGLRRGLQHANHFCQESTYSSKTFEQNAASLPSAPHPTLHPCIGLSFEGYMPAMLARLQKAGCEFREGRPEGAPMLEDGAVQWRIAMVVLGAAE